MTHSYDKSLPFYEFFILNSYDKSLHFYEFFILNSYNKSLPFYEFFNLCLHPLPDRLVKPTISLECRDTSDNKKRFGLHLVYSMSYNVVLAYLRVKGIFISVCTNALQRRKMKGVLPWLIVLGSSCRYKRVLSCLCCSSQLSATYFFSSSYTFSIFVSPSPSNLGRQSCRAAYLCMCSSGANCPLIS